MASCSKDSRHMTNMIHASKSNEDNWNADQEQ